MNRTEKEQFVAELRAELLEAKSVILGCHQGIPVNKVNELRVAFSKQGVKYRVVKNTLACLALEGTGMEALAPYFVGPIALGQRRAAAAKAYLVQRGIAEGRIDIVSYGEERPAVPNATTEAQHQQNRRDEFEIIAGGPTFRMP